MAGQEEGGMLMASIADNEAWDFIIVGGGSAGCVLANRLSADPQTNVLLLEAGGSDRSLSIAVPTLVMQAIAKHNWKYLAEPDESRHGLRDIWHGGKVLGGGSSISGMIYVRGHRYDYDHWSALGCEGWDYESLLPHFRSIETFEGGASRYRGGEGPLRSSHIRLVHPTMDAFLEAAQQAGIPANPDYNGESQEGVAHSQAYQRNGFRHNNGRAFIRPVRQRKNLTVVLNAFVSRILFDGKRALGVEYRWRGRKYEAHCYREVVLSAGAIASPKILMLSGIGPGPELYSQGIDVVSESPDVGQNLQEHPVITLSWGVNVPTINSDLFSLRAVKHGLHYLLSRRGPFSMCTAHTQAFVKNELGAGHGWTDLQLIFQALSYVAEIDEKTGMRTFRISRRPGVNASVIALHPEYKGSIGLRSVNPDDPPVIRHQLVGGDYEMKQLIAGARTFREIFSQQALQPFLTGEFAPGPEVESDADLEAYVRRTAWRGDHPTCTCRMGGDELSVVDPALRVRGVLGLRVADASIMPTLVSGNTNVPSTMIGEKASSMILEEHML
jgi:choline dehydrogenase